jgi:hypothetical protein
MKLRESRAHPSMVVGFTPIREPLLRGMEESGSGFEVLGSHSVIRLLAGVEVVIGWRNKIFGCL